MTTLELRVRQGFASAGMPAKLVTEVIEAFTEAKRRYYRGDLRPSEIEGGRFSEAVFRVLQWTTSGIFTPLGKTLPSVPTLLTTLEKAKGPDSVRLHVPRTLRLIYDVRNTRDAAHLADGIDPNTQDASLVIRNMEWVLAELVRLFHSVSPTEAASIISDLVSKDVPMIQMFGDFPRVLRRLRASDHMLVLLYWRGAAGATLGQLRAWARPTMASNLGRTLKALDQRDFVHVQDGRYMLTKLGERDVERRRLLEPE